MIKKLRKEFITIAIIAVVSVMVLLCVIVNVANFVSVNSKLNNTIEMISSNKGMMPDFNPPDKPQDDGGQKPDVRRFDRQFNEETPFSTRFFVLYYNEDGELIRSDLDKIAAVTQDDTQKYLDIALKKGEGYGFTDGYKYKVTRLDDGSFSAIFLDDYREISSAKTILVLSIAATVICSALICVLIVLFSKRAVKPAIESNKKQKQFITDASHELKTPITVISTSLSVLEMEVGKQKWIDKSKEQTEKLTELVNSLVTLSKMDEETPPDIREFNISDAVRETAESFSDFAKQNGHELEIAVAPSINYSGDEYQIRQLCSILIDNAIKYANEGSPIKFTLERDKRGVTITSENECENVNADELDRLFDRFYRADKSRNSQTGGFGIGLSIARSICVSHRGEIKAVCDNGHTVKFIAELR
jgi:signal transduction histidine kinase